MCHLQAAASKRFDCLRISFYPAGARYRSGITVYGIAARLGGHIGHQGLRTLGRTPPSEPTGMVSAGEAPKGDVDPVVIL